MTNDNPQIVKFTNEVIRPMSERLRALKVNAGAALSAWENLSKEAADDAAQLDDKRDQEGVSRLTIEDIKAVIDVIGQVGEILKANENVIQKPCVRSLIV